MMIIIHELCKSPQNLSNLIDSISCFCFWSQTNYD